MATTLNFKVLLCSSQFPPIDLLVYGKSASIHHDHGHRRNLEPEREVEVG